MELVPVLEVLDHKEYGRAEQGHHEQPGGVLLVAPAAQTGRASAIVRLEQMSTIGVDAAHHLVEVMVGLHERIEEPASEDGERAEQPAEEQDLRDQEEPDAHPAGVELRVGGIEVMGDVEVGRQDGACLVRPRRRPRRARSDDVLRVEVVGAAWSRPGCATKFSVMGGEAVGPLEAEPAPGVRRRLGAALERSDLMKQMIITRKPRPRIHEPMVEKACSGWNWSR